MKNSLKVFVVILYLMFGAQVNSTFASHAAGAEISYVCIGSGNYEITYTFYRDCYGITPNTSIDIVITNDCGFPTQTLFLNQLGTEVDVINVCGTAVTTCHGGSYSGIQKWTYRGVINLPAECTWYIGHGEPARNAALSTITGGGTDLLYVYCMINNYSGLCNNSPVFNEDPILVYCVGQELLIDPPVFGIDHDSLSFELITPRTGPALSDTVTFLSGYSADQPFICSLPMTFNPTTGIFRGIPSQTDVSIYAILVNEFRNGILIGQTERDMIVTAENCNNIIPILTGINGLPNYSIDVYANQLNCFFITAVDPNVSNQTVIEYDYSIPGMTFTTSGGQPDTAFFCWTPDSIDIAFNPYWFRVKVTDGNCPFLGISARNYYFNVEISNDVDEINENNFVIYPNPVSSELKFSSLTPGKVELNLFDIQGRQVINSITTESNGVIQFYSVEKGIYLLSIKSIQSKQTIWKRIVKN